MDKLQAVDFENYDFIDSVGFKDIVIVMLMKAAQDNILGVLSLMFWALTIIVSLKYLTFILRADNKGEGGVIALTALLGSGIHSAKKVRRLLILAGIFAIPNSSNQCFHVIFLVRPRLDEYFFICIITPVFIILIMDMITPKITFVKYWGSGLAYCRYCVLGLL